MRQRLDSMKTPHNHDKQVYEIQHYCLDDRLPVKVTRVNGIAETIEVLNEQEKKFVVDFSLFNLLIDDEDFSLYPISEIEYRRLCLGHGVKPI